MMLLFALAHWAPCSDAKDNLAMSLAATETTNGSINNNKNRDVNHYDAPLRKFIEHSCWQEVFWDVPVEKLVIKVSIEYSCPS
jgi:hypothetical protein